MEADKLLLLLLQADARGESMNEKAVHVRELAGWDLDTDEYRSGDFSPDKLSSARRIIAQRKAFETWNALLEEESDMLQDSLSAHRSRADLHDEMTGLEWSLGVVDLRFLLAFQRRLAFHSEFPQISIPTEEDWPALIALSFGPARPVEYELIRDPAAGTFVLQSGNPNLHLRVSKDAPAAISVHAGSPFFEVAQYRGRWFLRDGYHRAYALLQAGIFRAPAAIVQARTLEELGAVQPWFFSEEILFSSAPPRVMDFLDDALTIEYDRPLLIKTLRVTIEEALEPATSTGGSI
jgi:hypothetical protein